MIQLSEAFFTTESTKEKHGEHKALIVCNFLFVINFNFLSILLPLENYFLF